MSRAQRVLVAFSIGMVNQTVGALGGLWLTRFSLHRIGQHDYGLWVIAGQVLGYIALLDLGVVGIVPREVSVIAGKGGDPDARDAALREVFERSISLILLLVPLLAVAATGIVALLPADWAALRGPLIAYFALYVALYPFHLIDAVLTGLQDLAFLGWVQMLTFLVSAAATVALVLAGSGLYALAVGGFVGQIAATVASLTRLFLRHRRVVPRRFQWASGDVIRRHLRPGLWVSLGQVAHVFANATDIVVIGRILGPEAALRFSITDKTENMLSVQPFAIGNLSGPTLGELKGSGRQGELPRFMGAIAATTLILSGGIALAILETNHAFVRVWLGEPFFGGMTLTAVILANMMARHGVFTYCIAVFYYSGRMRASTLMVIADGVVSLALSIFLVRRIGIVGAPLGSLIAVLVTEWPAGIIIIARDSGTTPWAALGPLIPWLVRFIPIAVVAGAAGVWLGGSSLALVASVGAVIGAVYIVTMLPLLRRPPLDAHAAPLLARIQFLERLWPRRS
jgi:O-antigen/teichoic acid export membrane protein